MAEPSLAEVVDDALAAVPAPGAVVGVAGRGASRAFAAGTRGLEPTSAAVDAGDWFQIGSVTKSMTAVAVLQLVAEDRLALDDPVAPWLGLRLADAGATDEITVRHLLSHTSGLDVGDDFTDTGDGDDCLERYVAEEVSGSRLLHPVGERWSYCNGGYSALGRVLEVVHGTPFDEVLTAQVLRPAGIHGSTIRRLDPDGERRMVPGHRRSGVDGALVAERRRMPSSAGPAGNVVCDAESLLRYTAALFIDGRLLPAALVAEAIRPHAPMRAGGYGFGWMVPRPGIVAHGGSTVGHTAFLGAVPDQEAALVVLANGPGAGDIAARIQAHLSGRPAAGSDDVARGGLEVEPRADDVVGVYERRHVEARVTRTSGGLQVELHRLGAAAELFGDEPPVDLRPVGGGRYTSAIPGAGDRQVWDLAEVDREGRPTMLVSERVHRRREDGSAG